MTSGLNEETKTAFEKVVAKLASAAEETTSRNWIAAAFIAVVVGLAGALYSMMQTREREINGLENELRRLLQAQQDPSRKVNVDQVLEGLQSLSFYGSVMRTTTIVSCIAVALAGVLLIYLIFFRVRHLRDSRDSFAIVAKVLMEEHGNAVRELGLRLSESEKIAKSLRKIYEPLLISWDRSYKIEMNAVEVRALTPNMAWLTHNDHFLDIINDVIKNEGRSYHYLVYYNNYPLSCDELLRNLHLLRIKMSDAALLAEFGDARRSAEDLTRRIRQGVQIRMLMRRELASTIIPEVSRDLSQSSYVAVDLWKLFTSSDLAINASQWEKSALSLPLPGDLVIYDDVDLSEIEELEGSPRSAVVLSRRPVDAASMTTVKAEEEFDLLMPGDSQVTPMRLWFRRAWENN
jgi:hypothetical protein